MNEPARAFGWMQRGPRCWVNPSGYQVCSNMLRGVHYFAAWSPDLGKDEHERLLRPHYARGERVPMRREALGIFGNLQAAFDACTIHSGGT